MRVVGRQDVEARFDREGVHLHSPGQGEHGNKGVVMPGAVVVFACLAKGNKRWHAGVYATNGFARMSFTRQREGL